MKDRLIEISEDVELNRIFTKAHFLEEAEFSLSEGTLKFLIVEKIDKAEAAKVKKALDSSREQIKKLEAYINKLKSNGLDVNKIPSIISMIKEMGNAIDKAQGDFAAVNFESGKIASFMGSKMTAPGIAKAAIAIQTKVSQFLTGFTEALQNIEDNLVPLAKDDAVKQAPMKDIAGQGGIPDADKLEKGIKSAMEKSLKPDGMIAKLKGFFAKNMPGAQGKILRSIPTLDAGAAAQELADAIMGTSLSVFDGASLTDTKVPMEDLDDIAQDAVESEAQSTSSGGEGSGAAGDPKSMDKDEIIRILLDLIKEKDPERFNKLKQDGEQETIKSLEDDAEDVQRGKDPEEAAEEAIEEEESEESGDTEGAEGAEGEEGAEESGDSEGTSLMSKEDLQSILKSNPNAASDDDELSSVGSAINSAAGQKIVEESRRIKLLKEHDLIIYRMNKLAGLDK